MPRAVQSSLPDVLQAVADRIEQFSGKSINEQNTKQALINPVLRALGWDLESPDEVHHEFRATSKDNPVDYALRLNRTPRLFVEAKSLGHDLNDHKWVKQALAYASAAGVIWCVLTDGNEYRLYNSVAPVRAEQKLFCSIRIADRSTEHNARVLDLISRANLQADLLDECWNAHYVDRQVGDALRAIMTERPPELMALLGRATPKLKKSELLKSLSRLDIRIESPPVVRPKDKEPKTRSRTSPARTEFSLQDLIASGVVAVPVKLFRKSKGVLVEAMLRKDGTIEFGSKVFESCSTAASAARETITGRPMATNGWDFWLIRDDSPRTRTLSAARKEALDRSTARPQLRLSRPA